jgi:hypothetical protein
MKKASDPMAQEPASIQFDDIPLEDARRMGLPRMDPELYGALQQKLQSLGTTAKRPLGAGRRRP